MEYMFLPLRRYADFSGRSRRLEYWLFNLFFICVLVAGLMLTGGIGAMTEGSGDGGALGTIFAFLIVIAYLALLIPMLAVQVRRLHDQDKSGWFILLSLIPYAGSLILLVLMLIDGTPGPNRFGPDPKGRGETLANVFS